MIEKRIGDVRLVGFSLAGEETVVAAPELNVCFDVGRSPREIISVDTVCLSHGHMDHAAGLAYYFSQRNFVGNAPGTVLVPTQLVKPIRDLVRIWGDIEGHPSPANVIGLEPNQDHRLRRDLIVRTFAADHGAPALGFCVIETRRKLKPELVTLSGPQLVELKKKGAEIEYDVEIPLVCYPGDTADGSHFDLEYVRQCRVLLLECTFFEPDHVRRARLGKHLHVRDLRGLLKRLANPNIVLMHLSRRTSLKQARRYLKEVAGQEDLSRLSFLMERPRRERPDPQDEVPQSDQRPS
ncbi:MAG: MBL fold metallo-hydrolase [Phycisphaerae bacterium]|nr:MBL fold metallo-hydrolase [Phycisphaerae bacterium]